MVEVGELVKRGRKQTSAFGSYMRRRNTTQLTLAGSRSENIGEELKTQSRTP
jgi:hypothetical protein